MLIEGNDDRHRLDYQHKRKLWDAIERMYTVPAGAAHPFHLCRASSGISERPAASLDQGSRRSTGFSSTTPRTRLRSRRFQTFNFSGWGDAPDVLEPLLFYVLHRAANGSQIPEVLATFKAFLMDEAWLFIKNPVIREYVTAAQKTWRKHNAAMILATQSIKELEDSGMLRVVAESCPTKIFLANPEMNREVYGRGIPPERYGARYHRGPGAPGRDADPQGPELEEGSAERRFGLLLDRHQQRRDNLKKRDYFARYGIAEGIRRLAQDHPVPAHCGHANLLPNLRPRFRLALHPCRPLRRPPCTSYTARALP